MVRTKEKSQDKLVLCDLPPEILLVILCYLKTRDLNSVMLTSKWLNAVASNPVLWSKVFNINKVTMEKMGPEPMFEIDRLSMVKTLDLTVFGSTKSEKLKSIISGRVTQIPTSLMTRMLTLLKKKTGLKCLTTVLLDGNSLREIQPDNLVADSLGGLKQLSIRNSNITASQLDLSLIHI